MRYILNIIGKNFCPFHDVVEPKLAISTNFLGFQFILISYSIDLLLITTFTCACVITLQAHVGRHRLYGRHFLYCLIANLANLILQVVMTQLFLGGKFLSYGFNYSYGSVSPAADAAPAMEEILFPKMAK